MASEEAEPQQEQERSTGRDLLANRGLIILLAVAGVVAVIAMCVFGILFLRSLNETDTADADATPTPFPVSSAQAPESSEPLVVGVSGSSTVSVTLDAPVSMRIGGKTFAVQTQSVASDGLWAPNVGDDTAVWVYGTIINYVMGVSSADENQEILQQLASGDEIILTTRAGSTFNFAFNGRETVAADNREVFAQTTPGITLVLLQDEAEERLVVKGTYVVPETTSNDLGSVVELGDSAQVEDIQVSVTGATYMPDRPEAPPGFAFFLVDFEMQNLGLTAVDTSAIQLMLRDELGNQYAENPTASRIGNNPPLSGFLNANQTIQASAGYQVPLGLVSPTLTWLVMRGGSQAQVVIPFTGGGEAAGQNALISLQQVNVSPDRTSLVLVGQVANSGEQPLVVVEEDVKLTTNDGSQYLLLATNPAFPWTVPPGQTLLYTVTFQKPASSATATFNILNQPFQLTGLQ